MKDKKKQKPQDLGLSLRDPNTWFDKQAEERRKRQERENEDFEEVADCLRYHVHELHSFPDSNEAVSELTDIPLDRIEAIEDRIAELWQDELGPEMQACFG